MVNIHSLHLSEYNKHKLSKNNENHKNVVKRR